MTDPHNVGAILRSAEVSGGQRGDRHAAPFRARNRRAGQDRERRAGAPALPAGHEPGGGDHRIAGHGLLVLGLDGDAEQTIEAALEGRRDRPVALVLGAEGPGLREKTRHTVDQLVRIDASGAFGSLNVSNAAAIALYALQSTDRRRPSRHPTKDRRPAVIAAPVPRWCCVARTGTSWPARPAARRCMTSRCCAPTSGASASSSSPAVSVCARKYPIHAAMGAQAACGKAKYPRNARLLIWAFDRGV